MNKSAIFQTIIALLALGFTSGILQPLNTPSHPEPVPYRLCVPVSPAPTCQMWV